MTNIESAAFFREKIDLAVAATRENPHVVLCSTSPQQVHPRIPRTFFPRLVLVLTGSRLCRYGDGVRLIDRRIIPGEVLLVEPRATLWCEEEGEYELFSVVVSYNFIRFVSKRRREGEPTRFDPDAVFHCASASRDCLEELLHALSFAVGSRNGETAADILTAVWSLCCFALETPGEQPGNASHLLLEEALNYLEGHLGEPVTCAEVGRHLRVSGNYVSQLFARHMYCGFSEYLTGQRLELARRLLLHSDMNVGEIAAYCGFRQANYFIRVFHSRFHCTPLRYRASFGVQNRMERVNGGFFGKKLFSPP